MDRTEASLRELAVRIRQGDPLAAKEWQRTFDRQLQRIVQRALRSGESDAALARHIHCLAGGLEPAAGRPPGRLSESQIQAVARRLGSALLGRLGSVTPNQDAPMDTVRGR